jgi:putative transcriptional regulator
MAQNEGDAMMSKFYEELVEGLNEAIAFANGEDTGARVHTIEIPVIDVAQIRAQTGLSQSQFAKSIGVAKGTLLNWEHGRRHPTGPAQVLLAMIARRPSVVTELLRAA